MSMPWDRRNWTIRVEPPCDGRIEHVPVRRPSSLVCAVRSSTWVRSTKPGFMAVRRALPNLSAASPVMLILATVTSALAVEKVAEVGVWRKKAVVHRALACRPWVSPRRGFTPARIPKRVTWLSGSKASLYGPGVVAGVAVCESGTLV